MKRINFILVAFCLFASVAFSQTGGNFDLSHNVIPGGGGTSTGGQFTLEGTVGQGNAGSNVTGGVFRERAGFWAFEPLAPTAANVSVGGRIYKKGGRGIPRVFVTITDPTTNFSYQTRTNPFGYYTFSNIEVGETYVITVWHKESQFKPNSRVITVQDELRNVDFISEN